MAMGHLAKEYDLAVATFKEAVETLRRAPRMALLSLSDVKPSQKPLVYLGSDQLVSQNPRLVAECVAKSPLCLAGHAMPIRKAVIDVSTAPEVSSKTSVNTYPG